MVVLPVPVSLYQRGCEFLSSGASLRPTDYFAGAKTSRRVSARDAAMSLRRLFAGFRDLRSCLVSHGRSRKRTMYRVFRRILEINFSGKFRDEFGESRSFIWRTLSGRQLFAITYITFNTKYELNYCSDVHQSYLKKKYICIIVYF